MKYLIEAIQKVRATSWKNYKIAKPNAQQRREQFLKRRVKHHEERDCDNIAKKIEEISKNEVIREAQREIKHVLKPFNGLNILYIEINNPEDNTKIF